MTKKIIIKPKKLIEATVEYHGDEAIRDKINKRVVRALRTAEAARQAAANARANGNIEAADELQARAEELETWADIENNKFRKEDEVPKMPKKGEGSVDSQENKKTENPDEDSPEEKEIEDDEPTNFKKETEQQLSSQEKNRRAAKDIEKVIKGLKDNPDFKDKTDELHDLEKRLKNIHEKINNDGNNEEAQKENAEALKDIAKDLNDVIKNKKAEKEKEKNKDNQDSKDNKNLINPFKLNPRKSKSKKNTGSSEPETKRTHQEEIGDMKGIFGMLGKGEREGAKKALADILAKRKNKAESLSEALAPITKDLTEISDDEFNDIINDTLEAIARVKPIDISTDIETRVKEIEQDNQDYNKNKELEDEDNLNAAEEKARLKAGRAEIAKYRNHATTTDDFQQMLRLAIASQVRKIENEEDSWGEINRRHQNDDIIAPGTKVNEISKKKTISIQVYLDCSASFSLNDINKERGFLAVIDKYVREGKVAVEIFYFSNHIRSTFEAARRESGTAAWPEIIENIKLTNPTNVLIVTDRDMNSHAQLIGRSKTVPGCVWYIWKNKKAEELPKHLNGMKGTSEYWL